MTKIISLEQLYALRVKHYAHNTVVLATGVFDILHQEHRNFLTAAKQAGDTLMVGLETDQRINSLKEGNRPINLLAARLENIRVLNLADYVFSLPEDFDRKTSRVNFIKQLHPNILAVSENSPFLEAKRELMSLIGGTVKIVLPHNPHISTTNILAQTKKAR